MLSRRAQWNAPLNRLTLARAAREARGEAILDLTETNPTRAGLDYPLDEIAEVMARAARAPYEPEPLGLASAREAVASELSTDDDRVDPGDIVITASTSEAYSFLFKLLADPGDVLLTAMPSYPLIEHLAALELVTLSPFALDFQSRWELDPERAHAAIRPRTRAIMIVHPNNPTGSYLRAAEQDSLAALAAENGLAIVSDEVFYDFPLFNDRLRACPAARRTDVLTFSLGGLSKSAGLPHYKLAWIRLGGPADAKRRAIEALALIADNFLSVSTPVQRALPELFALGAQIRTGIQARIRRNLDHLAAALAAIPSVRLLPVEGGWSAVIRVSHLQSDEDLVLSFLETAGVLVHPGYFFDFEREGYFVVSLLTKPEVFDDGLKRVIPILSGP